MCGPGKEVSRVFLDEDVNGKTCTDIFLESNKAVDKKHTKYRHGEVQERDQTRQNKDRKGNKGEKRKTWL